MVEMSIDANSEGVRLDRFLRKKLPQTPLSMIYKSLRKKVYAVNGKKAEPTYRLQKGDKITFFISEQEYALQSKQTKPITIRKNFQVLYEDNDLLIVDKPALLASQPGTGVEQNNLVSQVKSYLKDSKTRIGLAHRIDRGTSGIVIIGKNRKALLALYGLFKNKKVEKKYVALVVGHLQKKQGIFYSFLKKTNIDFQHRMIVVKKNVEGAVKAETAYRVMAESKKYSLVELALKTGKMHQIRAQLTHDGHPVVGDRVYGNPEINRQYAQLLRRQFLHAVKISFQHPFTKKKVEIISPLPPDLVRILEKVGMQVPYQ